MNRPTRQIILITLILCLVTLCIPAQPAQAGAPPLRVYFAGEPAGVLGAIKLDPAVVVVTDPSLGWCG
jgi:hypothetical protein